MEKATHREHRGFGMKMSDTTIITPAAKDMAWILVLLTRVN